MTCIVDVAADLLSTAICCQKRIRNLLIVTYNLTNWESCSRGACRDSHLQANKFESEWLEQLTDLRICKVLLLRNSDVLLYSIILTDVLLSSLNLLFGELYHGENDFCSSEIGECDRDSEAVRFTGKAFGRWLENSRGPCKACSSKKPNILISTKSDGRSGTADSF